MLGLYLLKRNKITEGIVSLHYISMLLAAMLLPLLLHQNMGLVFMAGLSVFMLYYAIAFENKFALWISIIAMTAMLLFYLAAWMLTYFPALFSENNMVSNILLYQGVISGIAVVVALSASVKILSASDIRISIRLFKKSAYKHLLQSLLLCSLFLSMGWIGYTVLILLSGSINHTSVVWFITGSLFFILMIQYYTGKSSFIKKPLLYMGYSFGLLYPLLVNWNIIIYSNQLFSLAQRNSSFILLHYLALGLFIILGFMTMRRIYQRNLKNITLQNGIRILSILLLLLLLCFEYDIINLIFIAADSSTNDIQVMLEFNRHLPYSILMWVFASFIFIRSLFKHNNILSSFAVILMIGILLKIFIYDFGTLQPIGRSMVFIILGVFLIGFAMIPRLLKKYPDIMYQKNNKSSKTEISNTSAAQISKEADTD
jgi:hypothetical protein